MCKLSKTYNGEFIYINNAKSFMITFFKITSCEKIFISSALWRNLPFLLLAKIFNIPVFSFVWDRYPVILRGKRYDKRLSRICIDYMENLALRIVDKVIVPSDDFLPFFKDSKVISFNYWIIDEYNENLSIDQRPKEEVIKVIFAGQVNETRGLTEAYKKLTSVFNDNFILTIASNSIIDEELLAMDNVISIGFKKDIELQRVFDESDFGLVSLSLNFQGPAFPSKTFDYVSNGLPVLYFGPCFEHYQRSLIESGVGLVLNKELLVLNKETSTQMKDEFFLKYSKFKQQTCLNDIVNIEEL